MPLTPKVREIGIPVRSVAHPMLFPGERADGSPCILATMGQVGAPFFVLAIDPETGACVKSLADVPKADEVVSAKWSDRRKRLFMGSCYAGHLHRYDPAPGCVTDLGEINPEDEGAATFPCRMDEHLDGAIYIGSYGKCDLTRYDPDSGEFTRFGRMDPVDMYFYPLCGADGTVAGLVQMTCPHVVAFDPQTGEHRTVGPVADTDRQEGHVALLKGADGLLYIKSHEGEFRVAGMEVVPVDAVPGPMPNPSLPDGATFRLLDTAAFEYRTLEVTPPGGEPRVMRLDWQGEGTDLFLCRRGPDGNVYGSSMLPEHLFRCDPGTGECVDLGACSTSGGEAYSMGNLDGKLYIASYPAAKLSAYDPAKPYRFGVDPDANPRGLGQMGEVACRPRAMVCGPAGKVWTASIPDYGMWGGTLAWFDPHTETFGSHRHLIQDCSPFSMTWLADAKLLLVGFSIEGGTGAQPRAERTGLVLWGPVADEKVWEGDFGLPIEVVFDLCAIGDGMVYALMLCSGEGERPTLCLLDMARRSIVSKQMLEDPPHAWPPHGTQTMFVHADHVYGATHYGVYRAPIGTTDVEAYWQCDVDDGPRGGGAVVGDTWYFPTAHRLRALDLPDT